MRVLVLSTGLFNQRYGQQRYELNFLDACFKQGPDIFFRVILLNDDKLLPPWEYRDSRVKFVLCGRRIRIFSKIKFVLSSFWYALKDRASFIICGHINLSFPCLILSWVFKIKYLLLTHGTDVWNIKSKFKLKLLKYAYKLISVSRYTVYKIEQQITLRQDNIIILPNSIDAARFAPEAKPSLLVKKYNLEGFKVILTVARLDTADQGKGYDMVIAALAEVTKVIPCVKYILVGDGTDVPRIKNLISSLGCKDKVILTGFVSDDDLVSYYNLCDCFVMPSKQEGFGIVFLEALACGKPVIAGNVDGSKDALLDGELGILVDPDDINDISQAILDVLRGNLPSRLLDADYLRNKVIQHFDINGFSSKVKEIFAELIQPCLNCTL